MIGPERLGQLEPGQDLVHRDVQVRAAGLALLQHASAANDFEIEPIWNRVSGRTGDRAATSAKPRTTTPERPRRGR